MTTPLPPKPFKLAHGGHTSLEQGACFNELASVLAGEPSSHTNSPACVSPTIRRLGMTLNDRLDDERRQLLRPFVLRSLGTAADGREEERRRMCNEWLLHQTLPRLLHAAGREEAAKQLRNLSADSSVQEVEHAIWQARDEAWDARTQARGRLKDKIRAELAKRGIAAAVAAAVAVADAADAAAVAAAVAAEKLSWIERYRKVHSAVYDKVKEVIQPTVDEIVGPIFPSAIELLDRMLPESPLTDLLAVPLEDAQVICGVSDAR